MPIGRTSSRFERGRGAHLPGAGPAVDKAGHHVVAPLARASQQQRHDLAGERRRIAADNRAPRAVPTRCGRPTRRCSGSSGHSSTRARNAGNSSRKSSREPPKEMSQVNRRTRSDGSPTSPSRAVKCSRPAWASAAAAGGSTASIAGRSLYVIRSRSCGKPGPRPILVGGRGSTGGEAAPCPAVITHQRLRGAASGGRSS